MALRLVNSSTGLLHPWQIPPPPTTKVFIWCQLILRTFLKAPRSSQPSPGVGKSCERGGRFWLWLFSAQWIWNSEAPGRSPDTPGSGEHKRNWANGPRPQQPEISLERQNRHTWNNEGSYFKATFVQRIKNRLFSSWVKGVPCKEGLWRLPWFSSCALRLATFLLAPLPIRIYHALTSRYCFIYAISS